MDKEYTGGCTGNVCQHFGWGAVTDDGGNANFEDVDGKGRKYAKTLQTYETKYGKLNRGYGYQGGSSSTREHHETLLEETITEGASSINSGDSGGPLVCYFHKEGVQQKKPRQVGVHMSIAARVQEGSSATEKYNIIAQHSIRLAHGVIELKFTAI